MKLKLLACAFASIVSTNIIDQILLDVQAQITSVKSFAFLCQIIDDIPNTVVVINETITSVPPTLSSPSGTIVPPPPSVTTRKVYPVIPFRFYNESHENPLDKCTRVTAILQNIAAQKKLNFISSGRANEKNFICTVNNFSLDCSLPLFDLEKEEDPINLVNNLRWIANKLLQPLPLPPPPPPPSPINSSSD